MKKGKEASFEEFVGFIDFETSVISDPVYSRNVGTDKKPINVLNTTVKSDITSESQRKMLEAKADDGQVRFVKCIICQKAHELEDCETFVKKSIEEKKEIMRGRRRGWGRRRGRRRQDCAQMGKIEASRHLVPSPISCSC